MSSQKEPQNKGFRRAVSKRHHERSRWSWLIDNQFELSILFPVALLLLYIYSPSLGSHSAKYFRLSYYNPNSGRYAAGFDDIYLIISVACGLTGARAGLIKNFLEPTGRYLGLARPKDVTRFAEQAWSFIYYSLIYYHSPYFLNFRQLWTDWPQRETTGLVKLYILVQLGFWLHQIFVLNIEQQRKDHWQMLSHHVVTLFLIIASYAYHQTRIGHLIMFLMDVVDVVFPLAKIMKYLGKNIACDVLFGVFIAIWIITRHVLYLAVCWSIFNDFPQIIPPSCYNGTADNLHGPLPIPSDGLSYLLEPLWDRSGLVCLDKTIMYAFLGCLLTLQAMMVIWSTLIIRVAIRVLRGQGADDIRSDDESSEGEMDVIPYEPHRGDSPKPLTHNCAVIQTTPTSQAERDGPSGSGLAKYRKHKEILNRIGCDKPAR